MKIYSQSELKEKAIAAFKKYPKINKLLVTSDGQCFDALNSQSADYHSKYNSTKKELSITTFNRSDCGLETKPIEPQRPTVKELEKQIKELKTQQELEAILKAEHATGEPRQGVLKAIEKRTAELTGKEPTAEEVLELINELLTVSEINAVLEASKAIEPQDVIVLAAEKRIAEINTKNE